MFKILLKAQMLHYNSNSILIMYNYNKNNYKINIKQIQIKLNWFDLKNMLHKINLLYIIYN